MWNNNAFNNHLQNTVVFCRVALKPSNIIKTKQLFDSSSQRLYLFSKLCEFSIFDNMPKRFSISTKNHTSHFNLEMLKETSPVISDFIKNNPNELHYSLNINDEENVLSKFEQLYQGKTVIFDEDELPSSQKITKMLQIKNCPNYLKPESLKTKEIDSNGNNIYSKSNDMIFGVVINEEYFINFLNKPDFQTFKIKTKRKEYNCCIFGVYSSNIIRQIIEKNQETKEYFYDFEDEYDEFQSICDFFNFKQVDITSNNMDFLKQIADDLEINCIIKQIDNYINNYENYSKKIDEKQTIIDSIDNLFYLLYNIKNIGIEKVKIEIIQSRWSKTEENVQELAAFILQVVKPSFSLQKEMADLLVQLNDESNETNKLDILIPFLIEKLMDFFMPKPAQFFSSSPFSSKYSTKLNSKSKRPISTGLIDTISLNDRCVYSFIRLLYKRGIILKEKIIGKLNNFSYHNKTLFSFFLPEIVREVNPKIIDSIKVTSSFDPNCDFPILPETTRNFISKYLPDKIDLYEKMLDNNEPDDEITKSLIRDDVDTLQMIITRNEIEIDSAKVPYNIFDDFNDNLSLINYASFCGSLKCFKYLLLNNGKVDKSTLYFAVCGGNVEIIKIVDQRSSEIAASFTKKKKKKDPFWFGSSSSSQFWFANSSNYMSGLNSFSYYKTINNNNKYNDDENEPLTVVKTINSRNYTCLNYRNINNIIASAIVLHRNDLFDWLFEKEFVSKGKVGNELDKIAILSASHGNAHSLIEMIDKGFDISSHNLIFNSATNGFCLLTQLLFDIIDQKSKNNSNNNYDNDQSYYQSAVQFGNLSIFKLFLKQMSKTNLENAVIEAIGMNYKEIVNYFFEIQDKIGFITKKNFLISALTASFKNENDEWFNYLIQKFKKINPKLFRLNLFINLLNNACLYSNLSVVKTTTNIILNNNSKQDFSQAFINAASSNAINICKYFIDKKVYIDYEKLSLQVSELGSVDEDLFAMIINNANPETKDKFLELIEQAIAKQNKKLIEFLLKQNAPIDNALFDAVITHNIEIVDLILKYNSKPSFVNSKKQEGTVLHIAANNNDINIVKRLLLVPGIDPSLYNQEKESALIVAIRNHNIEIIEALLDFYNNDFKNKQDMGYEAFQTLQNYCLNEEIDEKMMKILKRFLTIDSIDPNMICGENNFFYKVCMIRNKELVEFILNNIENIDVNKYDIISYETPLISSISRKYTDIAELLLKYPKTDINLRNIEDDSALTLAVKHDLFEIVDLIINDQRFDHFESKLDFAFYISNTEISRKLSSLSFLDVNKSIVCINDMNGNLIESTPLVRSVVVNNIEKIDIIINHHSFDKQKSNINKALFIAAKENNIEIFQKLIKLIDHDINIKNNYNESLLTVASKSLSGNIVDEILNNQLFDKNSDQIINAFISLISHFEHKKITKSQNHWPSKRHYNNQNMLQDHLIFLNQSSLPPKNSVNDIMNKLFNFDMKNGHLIDFSKLLPNGKSFFTTISVNYEGIVNVSEFLIQHGVDLNMPDKDGVYPLENAIKINSLDLVTSLVNSNKIYFTQLKNNMTYLHLAARNFDSSILKFLVNKNIIDINSVNNKGDTPLIEACKFNSTDNVNFLFTKDNLDYLHLNNKGKDALDVLKCLPKNESDSAKKSKENYLSKLNAIFKEVKENNKLSYGNQFSFNARVRANYIKEEEEEEDDDEIIDSNDF